MFRQAENKVKIEGILSEIDLKYGSFERKTDGATVETIGGVIKVLVDQVINGEESHLEVPVHLFSTKYTKAGKSLTETGGFKASQSFEPVEYKSLDVYGKAFNDRVNSTRKEATV